MEPPLPRSQIDKLGIRMAASGYVTDADRGSYLQVLEFYQQLLDEVTVELGKLSYHSTSRVKTSGTLIEKLIREPSTKLSRINDVAGVRVVLDSGRARQNAVVGEIVQHFRRNHSKTPKVIDRRKDPRSGYRAVHIVVYPGNFPVEIQVRTTLQDSWAQIYEGLADQWGRDIRYGGLPRDANRPVFIPPQNRQFRDPGYHVLNLGLAPSRADFVSLIQILADLIDANENVEFLASQRGPHKIALVAQSANFDAAISSGRDQVVAGWNLGATYRLLRKWWISGIPEVGRRKRGRLVRRHFPAKRPRDIRASDVQDAFARVIDQVSEVIDRQHKDAIDSKADLVTMLHLIASVEEIEPGSDEH